MNETAINLSMNLTAFNKEFSQGQIYSLTFQDVLNQFSETFVFRAMLLAVAFFGVMLYLQYYTKQIEKKHRKDKRWIEYIEDVLNIETILDSNIELKGYEKNLILLSDIFFLPSVAFLLIFISYYTGWY